jgi:outer membrane protein assembly factor BamB
MDRILAHKPASVAPCVVWSAAVLLAFAAPAWAVIPGLAGPLQALAQMVPQILPFVAAGLAGLLSSKTWRARLGRGLKWLASPRGAASVGVVVLAVAALLFFRPRANRSIVAAAPLSAAAASDSWTMFRGNLSRTGSAGPGPVRANVLWSIGDPAPGAIDFASSPAIAGGRVYVGSAEARVFDTTGIVYCLDAASGDRIWQFQTEKQGFSSPAVAGGKIYVGEGLHTDTGCKIYCVDTAGRKVWATPTRSHTESSPAVVDGKVYAGAGEDGIYCLDAATGKPIWHRGGMHIDVSPAVVDGRVYVGTGYGRLAAMALDAATGKTVWEAPSDLPVWGPPAVVGGRAYFGIGNGDFVKSADQPRGAVWCLDAVTGKPVWRADCPDAVLSAIALLGSRVYAGCRDGKVYAFDAASGSPAWTAVAGGPVVASPATDGKLLYAAGGDGRIVALDPEKGTERWSLELAPLVGPDLKVYSSPAIAGGRLYVGTSGGKFFCLGG